MRIAHTSDLHVNSRGRLEDLQAVLDAFLVAVASQKVDLIVIAGDFFERRSDAIERTFLADFLQRAAEIAPVYGCKGNHDAAGDLEVFNRLETRHPIRIEERVTAEPGTAWMFKARDGQLIGCLGMAWVEKAHMASGLDSTVDADAARQRTIAAVRDLLTCLRAEATRVRAAGGIPILVTHVMLGGSVVSSGQILIGQGIELAPGDLADLGCAYVACGHVHVAQEFAGGSVAYSGNPNRHDLGEAREPKGYRLVTVDHDGCLVNEFIELPARRMVLLEADWAAHGGLGGQRVDALDMAGYIAGGQIEGALVRYRYRVRAEDLHLVDEAAIRAILTNAGAAEVQVEAVVQAETRARTPEIVLVQTTGEKLDLYLAAKGVALDDDARARVHAKLATLEGAAA